mgnify:CR=1 FL=1
MGISSLSDIRGTGTKKGDLQHFGNLWMDKVALAATAGAGGVFNWQNPLKVAVQIIRVLVDVTVAAPAAVTVDVGTAADGATSSDNLIDGALLDAIALLDNIENRGTNGKSRQKLAARGGASDFITATASATPTSLAGNAYIMFIEV